MMSKSRIFSWRISILPSLLLAAAFLLSPAFAQDAGGGIAGKLPILPGDWLTPDQLEQAESPIQDQLDTGKGMGPTAWGMAAVKDARLLLIYLSIYERLPDDASRASLYSEQQTWLKQRQKAVSALADPNGGSMVVLDQAGEHMSYTDKRIAFLKEKLKLVTGPSSNPATKEISEFWKVAAASWKAGPIKSLHEEGVDGTTQTHTSAGQMMVTEIRGLGEYGYTITHRLINTEDRVLLAVHEVSWESDPRKLKQTIYDFESSPARKHFKERKMKQHYDQLKSKPESVAGSYITEELDVKKLAILKEEHAYWWEGGLR